MTYEAIRYAADGPVLTVTQNRPEKRPPKFPGHVTTDMPAGYPWWNEPD